ncbi:hypothetical protein QFZ62_000230 [Clavibacter sp. B3I6]|nr:hypothetical protein [Clavibacter sp. B3I6]
MLDDDERVAEVAQLDERLDEPPVVPLVQADARLVEHVQHAREARADLRGQADALRLAARERRGRPREVQVVEADLDEELQAHPDLPQHLGGDVRLAVRELELRHERLGVREAHLGHVGDVRTVHEHREDLGLQALAVADRARDLAQVLAPARPLVVRLRLRELALDVGHDALEAGRVGHLSAVAVLPLDLHLEVVAAEDRLADLLRQLPPGGGERELEVAGEAGQELLVVLEQALALRGPRQDDAVGDAQRLVADEELLVDRHARAEAGALGAGAERRVEGEGARLDLGELDGVVVRAGQLLRVRAEPSGALDVDEVDHDDAVGEAQRRLERVGEAPEDVVVRDEAVDHHGDVVLVLLLELGRRAELDELPVHDGARVPSGGELREQVDELALLLRHDGADDLVPRAGLELHELIGDLLHGLAGDALPADGAVGDADAGPEESHVVEDLGDGADRGPRVAVGRLLVDGDRGAQALDEVDVGPVDLAEELARVRGERLDVAALALGEDRVEGEGRLAGPGEAGEDHQRVARDVEVDVTEIVDTGTTDAEEGGGLDGGD